MRWWAEVLPLKHIVVGVHGIRWIRGIERRYDGTFIAMRRRQIFIVRHTHRI